MRYEILVKGYLNDKNSDRFYEIDMSIVHLADMTTCLSGEVVDQSALFGILRTINNLGIELISVTRK